MGKPTPGPWAIKHPSRPNEHYDEHEMDLGGITGPDGEYIFWLGDSTTYYPSEGTAPTEADARLIAAAPDLLHALQRLEINGKIPKVSPLGKRARAAIAKATGAYNEHS